MAVGESGLQIYLQPTLHQGRLSDLAPAQSGIPCGRGILASRKRNYHKAYLVISGPSYLEEEGSGASEDSDGFWGRVGVHTHRSSM